jgi:hypothetical protein
MLDTFIKISQSQGWGQLYASLTINYMKMVVATAIGFATYEIIKEIKEFFFNSNLMRRRCETCLGIFGQVCYNSKTILRYMSPIYYFNLNIYVDAT